MQHAADLIEFDEVVDDGFNALRLDDVVGDQHEQHELQLAQLACMAYSLEAEASMQHAARTQHARSTQQAGSGGLQVVVMPHK